MSDIAKKLLNTKRAQAEKAGSLFLEAICGSSQAATVGKRLATKAARERGRDDVADIIDAEFEEEEGDNDE